MTKAELRDAARRLVESSCREQGLEVQITDPVVVGKIAAILRGSQCGRESEMRPCIDERPGGGS